MSPRTRILRTVVTLAALAVAQTALAMEEAPAGARHDTLGQVTITGHAQLERDISKFVYQIAGTENAEGLPRWNIPVCPLVTGLSRQEGERILERVSEAARAAQVPLAGERCQPNLYVVVIANPEKALAGLNDRQRTTFFGETNASVVRAFIDTARAVRVWYTSGMSDPLGAPSSQFTACTTGPFCDRPIFEHAMPTRLSFNRIWNLSRVVLVVDEARLSAVSPEQLGDYAAMVGLAEIRPQARLDDARTILRLFDPASAVAATPAGATDWDQGFLKSLYATPQKSTQQRSEIAHSMARELVH